VITSGVEISIIAMEFGMISLVAFEAKIAAAERKAG
jgi:hypothetical protein